MIAFYIIVNISISVFCDMSGALMPFGMDWDIGLVFCEYK
jgi:hypothetical protein